MKPKGTVEIETVDLSANISVFSLPSLQKLCELQKPNECLLETPNDFFLLKENVAFRFIKKEAKPRIFHVKEISINPDSCSVKVELSPEELLNFAITERVPIFETNTEFLIPSEIYLFAKKGDLKK
jgi:hypothetical protein